MCVVIPFPGTRRESGANGIRAAFFAGRWCIEQLADGVITGRTWMPTQDDAQRVAARISRRDRATLLQAHLLLQPGAPFPEYRPGGTAT